MRPESSRAESGRCPVLSFRPSHRSRASSKDRHVFTSVPKRIDVILTPVGILAMHRCIDCLIRRIRAIHGSIRRVSQPGKARRVAHADGGGGTLIPRALSPLFCSFRRATRQDEHSKVHRRRTACEVDEDVPVLVPLVADGKLVREVKRACRSVRPNEAMACARSAVR